MRPGTSPDPHPLLYQLNARALVAERGRPLDEAVDEAFLDRLADLGFRWVYALGVWATGVASREVSRADPGVRDAFAATHGRRAVDDDIAGSPFAVTEYRVHEPLGGDRSLARLRARLHARGLRLMVDFIPNHVALDHPWRETHPEFFILDDDRYEGSSSDSGSRFAYGRDPYFEPWRDTLQLNYAEPRLVEAMIQIVAGLTDVADGVRCDMAMLQLPDVFAATWRREMAAPFWPRALEAARRRAPAFAFLAEVYWGRDHELQRLGFDYTYDKTLYDHLRGGDPAAVKRHLDVAVETQRRSARFLENHDEPRAASVFTPLARYRAAAALTFLVPGLRFFHDGQWEGRSHHHSIHLHRRAPEPTNDDIAAFYRDLLAVLARPVLRRGAWRRLEVHPAWSGNRSDAGFVAFSWHDEHDRILVAVNAAPHRGQGFVRFPFDGYAGRTVRLTDALSDDRYLRDGDDLLRRGLYLDVPGHHVHVFDVAERTG
ncbi:MAG: alpha-amylase family glycosyl hydrolase [Myxococcota bacterium]